MSAVFMHDFPSFSEVPHGADEKAEVADKADGFQPLLPDFFFSRWVGLRGDNIGRAGAQFTTQPGRLNWRESILHAKPTHFRHIKNIFKNHEGREIDLQSEGMTDINK